MTTYAELVRELDSPHVGRKPSRSFVALVLALATAPDWQHGAVLARRAGVPADMASRILARLRRYGVVQVTREPGTHRELQRAPRTYYRITVRGCALASSFYAERLRP